MLLIIRQNWFLASRIAPVVHLKMISGNEFPSVFAPVFTASRRDKSTRFHCGIRIAVVASSLWLAPFGAQRRYYRFPTPSARHICRTINQTKNLVPAGRHIPMMSLLNGALEFLRFILQICQPYGLEESVSIGFHPWLISGLASGVSEMGEVNIEHRMIYAWQGSVSGFSGK